MVRLTMEIGLIVAVMVFGLEAVHYRNAVVAANIDLKRAWATVVRLREQHDADARACETAHRAAP